MTDTTDTPAARRARRKQDLLLASALARQQATLAIGQISPRIDGALNLYLHLRRSPVLAMAGVAGTAGALFALRRTPVARLLRWALVGWRLARLWRR